MILVYLKRNRKIDNGIKSNGIKINIKKENNEIYSAKKLGNIIETNLKNKSYKKIYYVLKKKNIIMNILDKKIKTKKMFTIINKENYNNKPNINTELINFKQNNINNLSLHKNWYNLIGYNRISSIPSGLILIITGRMLKLKKASRSKTHKLILGNTRSKNYDTYYKTIIEKNGSVGIKLKIYSNFFQLKK